MTTFRLIFLILAGAVAIGAAVLVVIAHFDMATMRTVRSSFNFDGLLAFLCGAVIAVGMVVLFGLWRLFGYEAPKATRDLSIWIAALWGLLAVLHVPFALSYSVDIWINTPEGASVPARLGRRWISGDGAFLIATLLWPLPAIFGLRKYRKKVSEKYSKLTRPIPS